LKIICKQICLVRPLSTYLPIALDQGLTSAWTLTSTAFMLLMFVGITLLESAQVRVKNKNFVVTKNMMIITLSLVVFFIIGYAFAFGKSSAGIVGAQAEYIGLYTSDH
jgi:ammonia channel protein AmtB